MTDINHPRACLRLWRGEADYLDRRLLGEVPLDVPEEARAGVEAVVATLRRCAGQLEHRLRWSGMLDE